MNVWSDWVRALNGSLKFRMKIEVGDQIHKVPGNAACPLAEKGLWVVQDEH